ncbi:MAG TPA: TetR/AcrR family transcriptional regulator [Acidimicrobiales bacterium]
MASKRQQPAVTPTGRPMQQRAIDTRTALLDAAIDCLVEIGYGATTTIETARRAGVSRGAQLHHFPTKTQLLTSAVERLLERRIEEFRKAFVDVPHGPGRLERAVDVLWSMFESSTFVAMAELWVAARTDPDLASAVVEMDRRFVEECTTVYAELFSQEDGRNQELDDMAVSFAFALMDGLAFQRLVPKPYQRPAGDYLEALKAIAAMFSNPPEGAEHP